MQHSEYFSYWREEKAPEFEKLAGDESAEAVIVGGGLCGLLCAYELLEKGVENLVLLEGRRIGSGTTGSTTAKITFQHDLIYHSLISGAGTEMARGYAKAGERAVEKFRSIIEKEHIDCDFVPCDAYAYTTKQENVAKIEDETVAAQTLSIDAEYVSECELPFPITAAVRFSGQARFHPLKFAYALAESLRRRGVRIYQDSPAFALEDGAAITRAGRAYGKNIILCTHYPFVNIRGFYFAKIVQSRSCVIGLLNAQKLNHMYVDCEDSGFSFRSQETPDGSLLILTGASFKTGHEARTPHYAVLEQEARSLYPDCEIRYRWSAQDCMTNDRVPFAGRYRQLAGRVYLATGFNKWGMTGSMAAADTISDLIVSGKSEFGFVFSPQRRDYRLQAGGFFKGLGDTVANFAKGYGRIPKKDVSDLKNGKGAIVDYQGKVGAFRDEEGVLHSVKPYCKHMGCPLNWNPEENTWDCPCHGSRYDPDGRVLENPALSKLEKKGPG